MIKKNFITSAFKLNKIMINIKVSFFNQEFDNYKGGSGKIIEMEKLIQLDEQVLISEIKVIVIKVLNECGYNDNWFKVGFTGRGIKNICIM
jgi:hypothetical protein